MAIITYTQDAVLGAYQQWLMVQGANACLERDQRDQTGRDCADLPGSVVAQAGSQIRYSVLTTLTSATVFFAGTFRNEAKQWQNIAETVVGTSAGGVDQVIRPVSAGCFRTFVASVGTAVVAGSEVYVLAELGRTNNGVFQPYALLAAGYVRTNEPIDMTPGPGTKNPPGGGSCVCPSTFELRSIDGIVSAQGWIDNYTPAANTVERVWALVNLATMGATVANRFLFCEIVGVGVGPLAWAHTPQTLVASGSYGLLAYADRGSDLDLGTDFYRSLPGGLWLSQEYQVQIGIGNFKTGDTIDDGYVIVEVRS